MQSLGFRLFLFFFLADVALFAMLVMPEDDDYMPPPAVIASEMPPRATDKGFISAAPSPNAQRATTSADTARPAVRYRQPAK